MSGETEATFICANCEDDFDGFPAGRRSGDRRPLCARCTRTGIKEGSAFSTAPVVASQFGGFRIIGLIFAAFALAFFSAAVFCIQRTFR